jgi:hypothetical protein
MQAQEDLILWPFAQKLDTLASDKLDFSVGLWSYITEVKAINTDF